MNREPPRTSLWVLGYMLIAWALVVALVHLTDWLVWWWRGAL